MLIIIITIIIIIIIIAIIMGSVQAPVIQIERLA